MVKEQEKKVELPGVEPRAFGFPCKVVCVVCVACH